jgi:hypothetical protein
MRLIAYLISVMVLLALADASLAQVAQAQTTQAQVVQPKAPTLRLLTWPGKVNPQTAPPAAPRVAAPARAAQPALPTSIYAPPPPAPAVAARPAQPPEVQALAQASPGAGAPAARFYSLHRAYGETPDPIPLGPQFFAGGQVDLAEPPPPAPRTFTTTGGRVVRAAPDDASN